MAGLKQWRKSAFLSLSQIRMVVDSEAEARYRSSIPIKKCGPTKLFRFRRGQILIKECDVADNFLFVSTGSCLIFRSDEEGEVHCVGSIMSPCFVGITDLFGSGDSVGRGPCGCHSVSVVAATHGFVLLALLLEFRRWGIIKFWVGECISVSIPLSNGIMDYTHQG